MIQPHSSVPTADVPTAQLEILPRARTFRFATTLAMPIQLQASIRISDRESPSGGRGVLDGAVVLAGLSAVLSFSGGSGMRKRGERSVAREVSLIPAGDWFVMSGCDFNAPIAEGAPVQVQFRDSESAPLTETLSLGLLGARPLSFCVSLCVPVTVLAEVSTDDRSFGPNSQASIGGQLVFPRGVLARCTYRRTDGRTEDGELLVGSADTVAVGVGHEIRFANRLVLTPAPARPFKSIAFSDGHGYRFAANAAPMPHSSSAILRHDGVWHSLTEQ